MRQEDGNYLNKLLGNSDIRSSRESLRKLAEDLVSYRQFKSSLQQNFEMDKFNSSEVISKIISLWIEWMGKEATLHNFEKKLRNLGFKAMAGKSVRISFKVSQLDILF